MTLCVGDLAGLLNENPPEGQQINAAPADPRKDKLPPLPDAAGAPAVDVLPGDDLGDLGTPLNMPPVVTDGYAKFPEGTAVRDILSGKEGTVAPKPEGDFGDVVFVTFDGVTSAVRSDQLENTTPAAMPAPGAPPALPGEMPPPLPAAAPVAEPGSGPAIMPGASAAPAPSVIKAKSRPYAKAAKMLPRERPYAKPAAKPHTDCAAAAPQDFVVTNLKDSRRIMFSALKPVAAKTPTHSAVAAFIGYIPRQWDTIVSRLAVEGIVLKSEAKEFDVAEFVAKKMTDAEIRLTLAGSGVRLADINAALIALGNEPDMTKKPADKDGYNAVWNAKANVWEMIPVGAGKKDDGVGYQVVDTTAEIMLSPRAMLKNFRRMTAALDTHPVLGKGPAIAAADEKKKKERDDKKTKKESTKVKFPKGKLKEGEGSVEKPEPTEEELAKEVEGITWHQRNEAERKAAAAKEKGEVPAKPEFADKKITQEETDKKLAEEKAAGAPRQAVMLKRKIAKGEVTFTTNEGYSLDIADWKKAVKQMADLMKREAAFYVDNGWDEDDEKGTFQKKTGVAMSELKDEGGDNTYNQSYFGPDVNVKFFSAPDGRWFMETRVHLGGDVRGNYSGGYYFEGKDKDELVQLFYDLIGGSLNAKITFQDGSTLRFWSESDSDMPYYMMDEAEAKGETAEAFLEAVELMDKWDRDMFLDSCVGR